MTLKEKDYCPKCEKSVPILVKNYSAIWHDGDVHCKYCGTFIRLWDAG